MQGPRHGRRIIRPAANRHPQRKIVGQLLPQNVRMLAAEAATHHAIFTEHIGGPHVQQSHPAEGVGGLTRAHPTDHGEHAHFNAAENGVERGDGKGIFASAQPRGYEGFTVDCTVGLVPAVCRQRMTQRVRHERLIARARHIMGRWDDPPTVFPAQFLDITHGALPPMHL